MKQQQYTEEEIQALFIDQPELFAELAKTNPQVAAYAQLFGELDQYKTPYAPTGLADKIIAKVELKEAKKESRFQISFLLGFSVLILILGVIFPVFLGLMDFAPSISSEYLALGFVLGILGLLIEWADHKYVHRHF